MNDNPSEHLWIYTQVGVFGLCSRSRWDSIFAEIVKTGWERPSAGEIGWLLSSLNPYPPGSFFTADDAASFSRAMDKYLSADARAMDSRTIAALHRLVHLFASGPIFIQSAPPRNTAGTALVEAVYVYSCPQCGFLHHGSWVFDTNELTSEEIRSTVEDMLNYTYCPLCGSKDIVSVPFFLGPFDPERAPDFMSWNER